MTRNDAIDLLVRHEVAELGLEGRNALLLDWWSIDADDPDYHRLPDLLRATLERSDFPDDPQSALYDPLLYVALRRSFVGVINSYLERRLAALGNASSVEGPVEELAECPCCRFRSLRERGAYEICRVCFWEDDGTTEPDDVSPPNRMTLREARRNFEKIGAVDEGARRHVIPDGSDRYAPGNRSS